MAKLSRIYYSPRLAEELEYMPEEDILEAAEVYCNREETDWDALLQQAFNLGTLAQATGRNAYFANWGDRDEYVAIVLADSEDEALERVYRQDPNPDV